MVFQDSQLTQVQNKRDEAVAIHHRLSAAQQKDLVELSEMLADMQGRVRRVRERDLLLTASCGDAVGATILRDRMTQLTQLRATA